MKSQIIQDIVSAVLALVCLGGSVQAQQSAPEDAVSANKNTVFQQGFAKLQSESEGSWLLSRQQETGLVRMLSGAQSASYGTNAMTAAQNFIAANMDLLLPGNIDEPVSEQIQFSRSSVKELPSGSVVEFQETYHGIPVYRSSLLVMVNGNGQIVHVAGSLEQRVKVAAAPSRTFQQIDAAFKATLSKADDQLTAISYKLTIYPGSTPRLGYLVYYTDEITGFPWEYVLDAATGQSLKAIRLVKDEAEALDRAAIRTSPLSNALFESFATSSSSKKTNDYFYGSNDSNVSIPDNGEPVVSPIIIGGAPADAIVTGVDVYFSCVHTFSADLFVTLSDESVAAQSILWEHEGSSANDPSRTVSGITVFNGLPVNGTWLLAAADDSIDDTGYIDEWWIRIYFMSDGNTYAVDGTVSGFTGGSDADSDGYYETYGFQIGINGDASPGPATVCGRVACPTTGQEWWTDGQWSIAGTAADYQFITFTEADFEGYAGNNTALDFTVELWNATKTALLATDTGVIGEPVLVDGEELPTQIFNPNPVNRLNNTNLTDQSDADRAVPVASYTAVMLSNLDPPRIGLYHLSGDYIVMEDIEQPENTPPTSSNAVFGCFRNADAFEEVMCYYHLTRNQAHIQSLGFTTVNNRRHRIDAHGLEGLDNSHYVGLPIGAGFIAFGDGGVDDAEDADVILHEYGHSIQDNSSGGKYFGTNNRGYGDETGAMGEGFGDYWACSSTFAESMTNGFNPALVCEWNRTPYLRRVDTLKTYPGDMVDQIHSDGEIWSACLWEVFNAIGREAADTIILESHFLVPENPSFADGANAILAAASTLSEVYRSRIREVFVARGILSNPAGDTDNDEIPDWWEILYFDNPTNCVADEDFDHDGQNNEQEYIAGTIPTNSASFFMVTNCLPLIDLNGFVLEWNAVSGRVYNSLWTTNLMTDFEPLATGIEYPLNACTDTMHTAEDQCFYLIEVQLK